MQSLFVAALLLTLFFSIHAAMERDRYQKISPEGDELSYTAQIAAYEMAQRHSAAIQWRRERSSYVGTLPADQLEPYGFNEANQSYPWVTEFFSNGVSMTYLPLENLGSLSANSLGFQAYALNQNPYSGLTTATGVLNSGGTVNLIHNLPAGLPVIGDVVRD